MTLCLRCFLALVVLVVPCFSLPDVTAIAFDEGPKEESCGAQRVQEKSDDRGIETAPGEFPWTLQLRRQIKDVRFPYCGATLIHSRIALTSGYCLSKLSKLNRTQDIVVRAGEWDDNDNEELLPHQDREVIYLTVHPLYDAKASVKKRNHNIGLVLVDRPFTISRNVQTICLPAGDDTFEGKRCVVASWGRDVRDEKNDTQRTTMKKVDLPIWSVQDCRRKVDIFKSNGFNFPEGTMCAGGEEDKDTCEGTGGSALACPENTQNFKRYTIAGIVSWGFNCGIIGEPGVFTDVRQYRKWIDDNIADMKINYRFQ